MTEEQVQQGAGERDADVIILGAGPTGLTLANLMGVHGVRSLVIEKNTTTVQAPRAVSIDDESLRTMQALGLDQAVIDDVALDYGSWYYGQNGKLFAKIEPSTREFGFPRRNAFTQPLLEATLKRGIERFTHVTSLFEHECVSLRESLNGVELIVRTHQGETKTLRALYVVACDGARSFVRKQIGAVLRGSTFQQRWLIVDLASTKEMFRATRVLCNFERPAITLPGPNGLRRYEFMLHESESDDIATQSDFVSGLLRLYGPDDGAPIVRRQVYTFHARVADKWSTKRIFIAGDAAHLTPPFAGQGMNSGIRDAHNLAWKLAYVVKGHLGAALLNSYQQEREPHARGLIDLALTLGFFMMPTSRLQAHIIQWGLRLASFIPPLHNYIVQMKYKPKPYYKSGFIMNEEKSAWVGRMVPQPMLETLNRARLRLDDIAGQDFVLMAIGPKAQQAMDEARSYHFGLSSLKRLAVVPKRTNINAALISEHDIAVRDVDDGFLSFVGAERTLMLIMRPDRYCMAAVDMADTNALAHMSELMQARCEASWV
jgi:3-(3-hydroxy-phenyl)propionate hydroxylase